MKFIKVMLIICLIFFVSCDNDKKDTVDSKKVEVTENKVNENIKDVKKITSTEKQYLTSMYKEVDKIVKLQESITSVLLGNTKGVDTEKYINNSNKVKENIQNIKVPKQYESLHNDILTAIEEYQTCYKNMDKLNNIDIADVSNSATESTKIFEEVSSYVKKGNDLMVDFFKLCKENNIK